MFYSMEGFFMKNGRGQKSIANKKIIAIIVGAVILVAAAVAGGLWYMNYLETEEQRAVLDVDSIYNNIFVNNIAIGGLSKEEALQKLEIDLQEPFGQNIITFRIDTDTTYDFTYEQLGVRYNIEDIVDKAYDYGKESGKSVSERFEEYTDLQQQGKYFDTEFEESVDKEKIKEAISVLSDKVYIAPKNATAERKNGSFSITPEENGREFDIDRAAEMVEELILTGQGKGAEIIVPTKEVIDVPTNEIQADYTSESFAQMKDLIGTYSTKYTGSGTQGRVINMRVAASRMNGVIIYPGEVFSTNATFGESTPENGYKLAGAYLNGKVIDDYGGGVCQVSSTLYNAVLRAELSITERQNHSMPVAYVPRGFDATLAGNYIDFKFKNSTDIPVYIESYLTNNQVVVNLYGKEIHNSGRTLKFENALISEQQPGPEKVTYNDKLAEGERKVTTTAMTGTTYKTYKLVYENGKLLEKVELATSKYKARAAEVMVGTGKASKEETTQPTTQSAQPAMTNTNGSTASNTSNNTAASGTETIDNTNTEKPVENTNIDNAASIEGEPSVDNSGESQPVINEPAA